MPEDKEAPVYTVERILNKRTKKGKSEYLIKWKGWATKWNTWEPEKHILDKLLIADFNNRNRKNQKNKSSVRPNVSESSTHRTRRLQSSTSSDISDSAILSPTNNDDEEEKPKEEISVKTPTENDRSDVYQLRPLRTQKLPSENEEEEEEETISDERPKFDESIRQFLWTPSKENCSTNSTITEVTDQTGSTVFIRELKEAESTSNLHRTPRILGYGNSGRGGKH